MWLRIKKRLIQINKKLLSIPIFNRIIHSIYVLAGICYVIYVIALEPIFLIIIANIIISNIFLSSWVENIVLVISVIIYWFSAYILNWLKYLYTNVSMYFKKFKKLFTRYNKLYEPYKFRITKKTRLLMYSFIIFFINIYWVLVFDPFINTFQKLWVLDYFGYYIYLGLDGISLTFTFLTSFFIPLCILFIWNTNFSYKIQYIYFLLSVEILIIFVFMVLDLLWFYIFFEAILMPFFLLIGLYGSRIRKIHASYLLFFYTICGSIWMLLSIIYIYIHTGTTNIQLLWSINYNNISEHLLWLSFFISFSVKIPIFPLHIWLPEAHVESPTEASVILAAILLKIGIYGFLRFLIPMFPYLSFYYSNLILLLNIISMVYTSLVTLRQIDIKRIIAYSSVGHMNICMIGIISFDINSMIGSLIVMVGHGFISGGLFFLIGILYDRYKTKIIYYYSGISLHMPIYSMLLFFFILSNISMPFTSNFIGELLILYKFVSEFHLILSVSICIAIFMCTTYSIWLYNRVCFGLANHQRFKLMKDLSFLELSILLPIVLFIFVIGIYPSLVIQYWTANVYYFFFY